MAIHDLFKKPCKKVTGDFVVFDVEQMNNEMTTKANPVKPNTSSILNITHKGICQESEVVQAHYAGNCWFGSHLNNKSQSVNQIKTDSCGQTVGHKPTQPKSKMMKTIINPNGAVASNGNNNTVRKAFTGFSKPQTLAEGEHAAVIASIEQVTGTDSKNKPVDQIEITVSVPGNGTSYALKRSYNMGENGRGATQLISDYNTLFGTSYGRNELYKLECEKLTNLPVIAVVAHNNTSKEPLPVLKAIQPVMAQPVVAAEPAPLAA